MLEFFTIRTFLLPAAILTFLPLTAFCNTENYSKNVKVRGQVWKNKYKVSIARVPHIKQRSSNCVPATVAMILRYYDTTVGQNNLAKLFKTSKKGTNLRNMLQGFAHKDLQKFSIKGFYAMDKADLRKNFQEQFTGYLKAGFPLLWSVDMRFDPVNRSPQGHMRVIIGYSIKNNNITHIIYRDSWLGGSNGDTMAFDKAVDMTKAIFLITPRDLDPEKAPRVKLSGKASAAR